MDTENVFTSPDPLRAIRVISERHFDAFYAAPKPMVEAVGRLRRRRRQVLDAATPPAVRDALRQFAAAHPGDDQKAIRLGHRQATLHSAGVDVVGQTAELTRLDEALKAVVTAAPPHRPLRRVTPAVASPAPFRAPYTYLYDRDDPFLPAGLDNVVDLSFSNKDAGVIGSKAMLQTNQVVSDVYQVVHDCGVITGPITFDRLTSVTVRFSLIPQTVTTYAYLFDAGSDPLANIFTYHLPFVAVVSSPVMQVPNPVFAEDYPGLFAVHYRRAEQGGTTTDRGVTWGPNVLQAPPILFDRWRLRTGRAWWSGCGTSCRPSRTTCGSTSNRSARGTCRKSMSCWHERPPTERSSCPSNRVHRACDRPRGPICSPMPGQCP